MSESSTMSSVVVVGSKLEQATTLSKLAFRFCFVLAMAKSKRLLAGGSQQGPLPPKVKAVNKAKGKSAMKAVSKAKGKAGSKQAEGSTTGEGNGFN